jgi:Flp pilus assembly protein TadG
MRHVLRWRRSMPRRSAGGWRAGQATVEFALVSLAFIPMVLGLIELGRGVWYYNQLSQLAREGARWIIVTSIEPDPASPVRFWDQVGNKPKPGGGAYTVATCACPNTAVDWIGRRDVGIPTGALRVTIQRAALGTFTWGVPVTVTVEYDYHPAVTGFLNIPATIPMRAQTTMHMQ